jgi:plastocyanin
MLPRSAVLALSVVMGLGGLLAACGDDDDDSSGATTTAAAAVTTAGGATTSAGGGGATTTAAGGGGATTTAAAGGGGDAIVAVDFSFQPQELTVQAGAEVTVTNNDTTRHTFTADDGAFDVELDGGATDTVTVDEAGSYPFHCQIHPSMTGTLTVEG